MSCDIAPPDEDSPSVHNDREQVALLLLTGDQLALIRVPEVLAGRVLVGIGAHRVELDVALGNAE